MTKAEADDVVSLPARVSDLVGPWAERSPNQVALAECSGVWTYKQLQEAKDAATCWLKESGVRAGDRVILVFENCRIFVALLLACSQLDAWPVLVNARISGRELDDIQRHCGARCVAYTSVDSRYAAAHAATHEAVRATIGTFGAVDLSPLDETAVVEPVDWDVANRVAALIYTSGTTGAPKGVMLTHRNLLFIATISSRLRSITTRDRVLGVLPMSHAVGLSVVLLGTLHEWRHDSPDAVFRSNNSPRGLHKEQLTIVLGVPAMFAQLLEYARFRRIESYGSRL